MCRRYGWLSSLLFMAATGQLAAAVDPIADAAMRPAHEELESVLVQAPMLGADEHAAQRVAHAAELLRDYPLRFSFLRRYGKDTLRGRPVAFAAWSERHRTWHLVEVEIPYPVPRKLKAGKLPSFRTLTPGYTAEHVRGVGAERLMFAFSRDGEQLRVYGRKYPIIESAAVKKLGMRGAVAAADLTLYLPMNDDVAPLFVAHGHELLRRTAEAALHDLRTRGIPSTAYPGKLLANTILPETLVSLAVIEQTDDGEFTRAPVRALNNTIGQYGAMRGDAFTYSVSTANAIGPMQFTNRRGNGTYSLVVRKCPGAGLIRDFEDGSRDLFNAMKAAACLLDLNMQAMPQVVQDQHEVSPAPVSVFSISAYNGGNRNAGRLLTAIRRLKAEVADLRIPDTSAATTVGKSCPCIWLERDGQVLSTSIPRYNRENIGYVDKYLRFMGLLGSATLASDEPLAQLQEGNYAH